MKNKIEFSKKLLVQESVLIWIITIAFIVLAFVCVFQGYFGELPWLVGMCGFPWTAYGASQGFYFKKSEKENTKGGIKYDTTLMEYQNSENSLNEEESSVEEELQG